MPEMTFYGSVKASGSGRSLRLTIPKDAVEALNITPKERFEVWAKGDEIVYRRV